MENFNQKVGDKVEVMFNIESRQWKDRWFTELVAWKVNMTVGDSAPSQEMSNDDIPF